MKIIKGSIYLKKLDILFIQERFNKLIYSINTIIKCGIWQPVIFQFVPRFFFNWIKNEMIFFYRIPELMLATLIQRYNKKSLCIQFKNKRLTEIDATFYDRINTIYLFIKPFLDKNSISHEYGSFKPLTEKPRNIIFRKQIRGCKVENT